MKKIYLLSGPGSKEGFSEKIVSKLKEDLKGKKNVAFIVSSPKAYDKNDLFINGNNDNIVGMKNHLKKVMEIDKITIIDERIKNEDGKNAILNADVVYLLGGNPFTQLEYIKTNKYDEALRKYDGIILGTSAGAMNLSEKGYYSKDEDYPESFFYDAIGMTNVTIDPHFEIDNVQQVKEAKKFSENHIIVGLPNSSAIRLKNNHIEYIGKCYIFENGIMTTENK